MASALGLLLLLLGFYGFAFGATRLLLRRSRWENYSLEAPWLTGPALVVLALSLLGYRNVVEVTVVQAGLLLAAGWGLSAVMVGWDRHELLRLARSHGLRWLTITVPALIACAVMVCWCHGNVWDDISMPWIMEYINYAELAATLTGHHQGVPATVVNDFCAMHRQLRIGQDLVVATVAQLAQRHPLQVILPIALVLRLQQTVVIGLLLCSLTRTRKQLLAVFGLLLVESLLAFELVSFASSFFSSNCTIPLFSVYVVWLACQQEFGVREAVIVVLLNLFFLLTYPEFLVLAKCFELLSLLIALWRRNRLHWMPLLMCNVVVLLANPPLCVAKFHAVVGQLGDANTVGFSIIGDPLKRPVGFLATVLGLSVWGEPLHSLPPLSYTVGIAVLLLILTGLVILARKYRVGLMLLAWAATLAITLASGAEKDNYYAGFKVLAHTYFLLMLAVAAALFAMSPRWRRLVAGVLFLWLGLVAISTDRMLLITGQHACIVSYTQLREAVTRSAQGREVTELVGRHGSFGLLNLISGETGVSVAAVTPKQQRTVRVSALGLATDHTHCQVDGTYFRGLVLVDNDVLKTGQFGRDGQKFQFECGRILDKLGVLALCEGRVSRVPDH